MNVTPKSIQEILDPIKMLVDDPSCDKDKLFTLVKNTFKEVISRKLSFSEKLESASLAKRVSLVTFEPGKTFKRFFGIFCNKIQLDENILSEKPKIDSLFQGNDLEKEAVFRIVDSFFDLGVKFSSIFSFIECIKSLSVESRDELIPLVFMLIRENMSDQDVIFILKFIQELDPAERKDIVTHASFFVKERMTRDGIKFIVHSLKRFSSIQRVIVVNYLAPLIKKGMSSDDLSNILINISKIAIEEQESTLKILSSLVKDGMSSQEIWFILMLVENMPPDERIVLCSSLSSLLKADMSFFDLQKILIAIQEVLPGDRKEVCDAVSIDIKDRTVNSEEIACVKIFIVAIRKICPSCVFSGPVFNIPSLYSFFKYLLQERRITHGVSFIELKKAISDYLRVSIKEIIFENSVHKIFDFIPFIKCYLNFFYTDLSDLSITTLLMLEIEKNSSEALCCYKSREASIEFARHVLTAQGNMQINDEDPLIQAAVRTILLLEYDKGRSFKPDPYNYYVYASTKAIKGAYKDIESTVEGANLPLLEGGGVYLKLNCQTLQQSVVRIRNKSKTYKEFMAWIEDVNRNLSPGTPILGPRVFHDLLNPFLFRIESESLKDPENQELKMLEEEIKKIRCVFIDQDGFVFQSMRNFGPPESLVHRPTERLYQIAKVLLDKNNSIKEGQLLTDREEAIKRWLSFIEECSVGQERGITFCYNSLKASGEISGFVHKIGGLLEIEKCQDYLDDEIQKIIDELLPEVLRELGLTWKNQGVHQLQTLKNILGEEAGIDHMMTMDEYAGTIDKRLLLVKRQDVLRAFFYLLTRSIVECVKQDITLRVKEETDCSTEESSLYDNLMVFFDWAGINPFLAWKEFLGSYRVCFPDGVKKMITVEVAIEYLSYLNVENLYEIRDSFLFLTKNGVEILGDGWTVGLIEDRKIPEFLYLIDLYSLEKQKKNLRSNLEGELKKSLVQNEREDGTVLLHQTAQVQFSNLFPGEQTNWISKEMFVAFFNNRLDSLIKSPQKIDLLINQGIQRWKREFLPLHLEKESSYYGLTDYGVISLLEKSGYIEVEGLYKSYLDCVSLLFKEEKRLNEMPVNSKVVEIAQTDLEKLKKKYERISRIKTLDPTSSNEDVQSFEEIKKEYNEATIKYDLAKEIEDRRDVQIGVVKELKSRLLVLEKALADRIIPEDIPLCKPTIPEALVESFLPNDIQNLLKHQEYLSQQSEVFENLFSLCKRKLSICVSEEDRILLEEELTKYKENLSSFYLQIKEVEDLYKKAVEELENNI